MLLASRAWCRPFRAWRSWRCSFRCCSGISSLTSRWFGFEFSALGFLPSVLALALYSVLPVLRNTIAGVEGIDPALKQAARGVGMTPWQSLRMVELPLAAPVIMAGIRTSAVWVIGTATLSTPVGQTSLGNYIFTGLQTQNWIFVLFGCVFSRAARAGRGFHARPDGARRSPRAAEAASWPAARASC